MAQAAKPDTGSDGGGNAGIGTRKQVSYVDLDSNDGYEKYRGNCGREFGETVMKSGGYRKWFDKTFKDYKDNIYDDKLKITFGVTFGGLMRDRMKFPKLYTYDYDIILRIVRGEKRFIGGYISSQEYVYNLYIKSSIENQSDIVSKFLKKFSILSGKQDAAVYKDRRRSLSLGVGTNNVAQLVDRTSQENNDTDNNKEKDASSVNSGGAAKDASNEAAANNDDNKEEVEKSRGEKEEIEESKYEHRVCNAHSDATDAKIKSSGQNDISKRIGNKYSVLVTRGIPDFASMKEKDEVDVIVSFVRDDFECFQATYLKKLTFKDDIKEKKRIYDLLYKWPKSASEVFGKDNIPKQKTQGLLSVFTTVSSTKTTIKLAD